MATASLRTAGSSHAVLYVHPDCSKSRGAVELLQARGIGFERRDYLAQPLDAGELRALIAALGVPAGELLRIDDARGQGLLPSAELTGDAVVALLQAHPALMQRPVLRIGDRAVIARPPERALQLL
jgi:arsenate reductase (glutaredoxin)